MKLRVSGYSQWLKNIMIQSELKHRVLQQGFQ